MIATGTGGLGNKRAGGDHQSRILRRVLETCYHSDSNGKPSVNVNVKNYIKNNNNLNLTE